MLFVALSVKLKVPVVVGVPEITPDVAFKVTPGGKFPVTTDQVIPPPVAAKVKLDAVPTLQFVGAAVVVIFGAVGCVIEIVTFLLAVCPVLFVTTTVKVDEPTAVGVPDKTPACVKVSPAGKFPLVTAHVKEVPPVAVKLKLYATPTVPFGGLPDEMVTPAGGVVGGGDVGGGVVPIRVKIAVTVTFCPGITIVVVGLCESLKYTPGEKVLHSLNS